MFEKNFIHHIAYMPHKIFLTFLELYSKTALKKINKLQIIIA
jgi:hypothetical protein